MTRPRSRVALATRPGGGSVVLRLGPTSTVLRPRAVLVCGLLAVAAAALAGVSLSVGDFPVAFRDVLGSLGGDPGTTSGFLVRELRLPRVLSGLLVGAALGVSGAITQSVARNALASPDVLGVTAGASAGAVTVLVLGTPTGPALPLAALAGGLVTSAAVYLLAYRRGVTGARLVLVGIGVSALLTAFTSYLLIQADIAQAQAATVWLTGSLNGRGWDDVQRVGLAVVVIVPLTLLLSRAVSALQLGDDSARGLGVAVDRIGALLVLLAVGLAALATSAAGPVAFVALAAPQAAQRLARTPGLPLVVSALLGSLLVVGSDLIARQLLAPTELPVGVVTAVLGAPVLLVLLGRATRTGER